MQYNNVICCKQPVTVFIDLPSFHSLSLSHSRHTRTNSCDSFPSVYWLFISFYFVVLLNIKDQCQFFLSTLFYFWVWRKEFFFFLDFFFNLSVKLMVSCNGYKLRLGLMSGSRVFLPPFLFLSLHIYKKSFFFLLLSLFLKPDNRHCF